MCCRVQVPAPGRLAPSFWIAVAGIAAAAGALAFEDEVDAAKFARGVKAGARRVAVSSGHDAPPALSGLEAGRVSGRQWDRSVELIPAPKRFLDEAARAGGGIEFVKMFF